VLARGGMDLFTRALSRSATQIVAFLVNAAKGTPIASFIGAPELLSALTDITSFSSGRATTYTLLLIFYTAVVMIVVWLCGRLRLFLERRRPVLS
jgi:ABC-type amino acid transport system permease subunit